MKLQYPGRLRLLIASCLIFGVLPIWAEKPQVLESPRYRVFYPKAQEAVAGEILRIAETVWPALAKAYDAYDNYQTIDIFLVDQGDYANGNAIYSYSRVEIYLPHLNWVMRGRTNWLGNVVTHELSHVFSLRQKAHLAIFSDAVVGGYTYNRKINWSFVLPWVPMAAPTWWVEGIAQFEAETAGFDVWDSQRDMIVRDAWLTGTLPTLGQIETFDGDWVQAERTYNAGFCFLRFLRDRYGIDKVRALAVPKPIFHFGGAVEAVYGKTLPALFQEWHNSLAETYSDYQALNKDAVYDPEMDGSFTQNLAISKEGRYVAWLGNADREYSLNWIFWKDTQNPSKVRRTARPRGSKSGQENDHPAIPGSNFMPGPAPTPFFPRGMFHPALRMSERPALPYKNEETDRRSPGRSEEVGSAGLEFNQDDTRLLTTRNDQYSPYNDIWEYEFRSQKKSEEEKWHRLTWNIRATYAAYHPKTPGTVVFAIFMDGSSNIAVLDAGGKVRQLTRFREGQQVYNPRFTPSGDSIYFTLGIGPKEAIAVIPANSPAWDPFEALKDSALFPDSVLMGKGARLRFVTPLAPGSYRDIRFCGDTLVYSFNGQDGAYNVFARVPSDSVFYRLTHTRTQALEPLLRDGNLYYQGYEKQHFRIFKAPVQFVSAGPLMAVQDTFSLSRPKKLEFTKAADVGEPSVKKVAWSISPYLNLSPRFLDDTTFTDLNLDLGLTVQMGPVTGGVTQNFSGYVSKRMDLETPLDYGGSYGGTWDGVTAWHQRFGWTPNLQYGLSRDVRHQNYRETIHDSGRSTVTGDSLKVDGTLRRDITLTQDMIQGNMSLPLSGQKIGPGYLQTVWYGRYWNYNLHEESREKITITNITTTNESDIDNGGLLLDAAVHRHFFHTAMLQWVVPAFGTPLPRYIGFFLGTGQWWARYASDYLPTDSIPGALAQSVMNNEPITLYKPSLSDFKPWQVDMGGFGAWSEGDWFQLSVESQFRFYTHKFPSVTDQIAEDNFGNTVTVENPHPNLWVLPYRLGLDLMPGYPYSFSYRGHDILRGTAMTWGRLQADFPVKIRKYLGYPSPFSSLNKIQLSLISDAGAVLNKTPDKIFDAFNKGQHHLLVDFGAKISMTFLFYHFIPMEIYGTAFIPYNQLKADKLYTGEFFNPYSAENETLQRNNYLDNVKEPRFFFGLTFGNL